MRFFMILFFFFNRFLFFKILFAISYGIVYNVPNITWVFNGYALINWLSLYVISLIYRLSLDGHTYWSFLIFTCINIKLNCFLILIIILISRLFLIFFSLVLFLLWLRFLTILTLMSFLVNFTIFNILLLFYFFFRISDLTNIKRMLSHKLFLFFIFLEFLIVDVDFVGV